MWARGRPKGRSDPASTGAPQTPWCSEPRGTISTVGKRFKGGSTTRKSHHPHQPAAVALNLDKHYLLDLQNAALPVVPVIHHATKPRLGSQPRVRVDDLVIKPTVSGAAKDTYRVTRRHNAWHLAQGYPDPRRPLDLVAPTPGHDGAAVFAQRGGRRRTLVDVVGGHRDPCREEASEARRFPGPRRPRRTVVHDMTLEERAFAERAMDAP